jgi:hypothetical protein
MDKPKTIYDLKLHESVSLGPNEMGITKIIRVHKGWIYVLKRPATQIVSPVFVPDDRKDPKIISKTILEREKEAPL